MWTAPQGAVVGEAVTLDGRSSMGDGRLTCIWSFEDEDGSTVWGTRSGCGIEMVFLNADTKYVKLTVTDADGDTSASRKSFTVSQGTPTATATPDRHFARLTQPG